MVSIPSFFSRGASGAKAPEAPGAPVNNPVKPGAGPGGKPHKPGQDAPDDLAGNQLPEKGKMSTGDKMQVGGNVLMAGSLIVPMIPGLNGSEKKKETPPGPTPEGQQIEDPAQYKQNQVKSAVGPTPINW
ncbi:MAG: hypothetical protein JWP91_2141 [Fibrobacteres bacterium]|nr:hypothetical protein [Fibrobacterota bacterium]